MAGGVGADQQGCCSTSSCGGDASRSVADPGGSFFCPWCWVAITMTGERWLLRGGRVVDPVNNHDAVADVLVSDGLIQEIGSNLVAPGAREFSADGLIVIPGLIDVHVHLRSPGFESKETITTGTAAAAAGGFTSICCMPNTKPAIDRLAILTELGRSIERDAMIRVFPIAAITKDRAGEEAVDFAALASAGAIGYSDDGDTTRSSAIMQAALTASRELRRPIMVHCEDPYLRSGVMHEGDVSARLGLSGIPAAAEEIIIARDLMLSRLTGGWLHVCHVSTGLGADLIRHAKRDGTRVTAEVMPHHLLMDDQWVAGDRELRNVDEPAGDWAAIGDPNTKVNPPLRRTEDTRELIAALKDGTLDLVATDHAPHDEAEKAGTTIDRAAFGMSGLEFALPLMLALVRVGQFSLAEMVRLMSVAPARLLPLRLGCLTVGAPADITVFDPNERWTVRAEGLATKSANTPLLGMELRGRVRLTLVDGEVRFHA